MKSFLIHVTVTDEWTKELNGAYVEIKCQLDATDDFYCRSYCLLNMFRTPLCPSSGAREYYTGGCCLWYSNHLYNTLELLMMDIVVSETCWASNKICNKRHLLHLVGILFPHINDDARSKWHQIWWRIVPEKTAHLKVAKKFPAVYASLQLTYRIYKNQPKVFVLDPMSPFRTNIRFPWNVFQFPPKNTNVSYCHHF